MTDQMDSLCQEVYGLIAFTVFDRQECSLVHVCSEYVTLLPFYVCLYVMSVASMLYIIFSLK